MPNTGRMLAQILGDSAAGAFILLWLLLLFGLAFIPASIASNKGYSGVGYYFFGLFFFLPALIVALVIPPSPSRALTLPLPSAPSAPGLLPQAARGTRDKPPGPRVVRECPFCKEAMRRDASVCPLCRRESPAWEYREGRWWTSNADGQEVWYDEAGGRWRTPDEIQLAAARYRPTLVEAGDPLASVRFIRQKGN